MPVQHRQRTGFTYIEMVITLLVMGILTAVAAPKFVSALASRRVDLAASRIVADLHYARSEAQRVSKSRTVEFNVISNNYTLINVVDLDHSTRNYTVELVNGSFDSELVSAVFGVAPNVCSSVIFDMFGRPDQEGVVIIRSGSLQRIVTLAADGTATKQ